MGVKWARGWSGSGSNVRARADRSQLLEASPDLKANVVNRSVVANIVSATEHVIGFRGEGVADVIAINEVINQLITRVWFVR